MGSVAISSWLFPFHYLDALVPLEILALSLSVTRSARLVGLALLLNVCFFARYGLIPWRADNAAPVALPEAG